MPYNVIALRAGRSEIVFCESAQDALDLTKLWTAGGVTDLRIVSTEGIRVAPDHLKALARTDARIVGAARRRLHWG